DSGTTVVWLQNYFAANHKVASVKICSLIDKHERRSALVTVDYIGFELNKGFLVGYGLDYAQKYRTLPEIYSLKEEEGVGYSKQEAEGMESNCVQSA
ncbi:MAG: hypothetical protein D3923_17345, partial [Candidatus Electrothrix sp. AR3]|nr:hypothetical protein [Candidatus Electrothrix sp. AR3]